MTWIAADGCIGSRSMAKKLLLAPDRRVKWIQ
jgi:hypothetical protein